jgi:hypothetical protein
MRNNQFKKRGAGIHSNIDQLYKYALKMGGVDTTNLMAGEKHVPLYINGKFVSANFAGPGTKLDTRLKRGDKPLSETDKIAMAHDLRYSLATSGQEISNADKIMLNKLKTVNDSAINKYPSTLGISAKYVAEKLIGTKYPNKARLENNPQKDNEFFKEKLKDLEQQGYGIDPAAHLKLKLMNLKPKQERSVKGSAVVPFVKPAIQQVASNTIDKVDYSKSEQSGDGCGCHGSGIRLAGKGCGCMSGSGLRIAGGFAFLAPLIPFLVSLGKAAALAAATTAAKRGVDAIFDNNTKKKRDARKAIRMAKREERKIKRGKGVGEDIINKLKNVGLTIKDFSKSALAEMEQYIKNNATKENAMELIQFLKPFVISAISAKINSEIKKYEDSLYPNNKNEEDEYDWDNLKYDDDEEINNDDNEDFGYNKISMGPAWRDMDGSGQDIPMIKENIISDAEALKIFNKTVDMSKIQDGEGLRLAGAPSALYRGNGNKKTLINIMNEIKRNPEILKSVNWINEQSKNLNSSGKNILNSFLKKYNSSIQVHV